MRLYNCVFFLTFVLTQTPALSAPSFDYKPPTIGVSPKDSVEEIPSQHPEFRDWSLRLGLLGGKVTEAKSYDQLYYYGLRYSFFRETLSTWDFEITTGGSNFMHISLGRKFYFPLESVTLPFYRFAVGDLIDSSENLGSLFNIKKIQGLAAIGLDDLFLWNQHLQCEVSLAYAIIGPQLEFSLGLAF